MKLAVIISTQRSIRNEVELIWGSRGVAPSRRKHRGSGGRAPRAGRFLRFFNKNDVISGIFEFKFLLQNIF